MVESSVDHLALLWVGTTVASLDVKTAECLVDCWVVITVDMKVGMLAP